jgi:hypothetical protein
MKKIIFLIMFVMMSSVAYAAYQYPMNNTYNARYAWQFNESVYGVANSDFNSVSLVKVNTVNTAVGVYGNASSFGSGANYLVNSSVTYKSAAWANFTACFWMYPTACQDSVFVDFFHDGNNRIEFYCNGAGRTYRLLTVIGGSVVSSISTKVINLTQWQHTCFALDNTNMTLWINGVRDISAANPKGLDDFGTNPNLVIGNSQLSYAADFTGYVDEFLLFNYSLTDSQINNIFYGNVTIPSVLVAGVDIVLKSPINYSIENTTGVPFTYTINYTNINISNCSIYTNMTSSWAINKSNTSAIFNNSDNTFSTINFTNGDFLWNVYCCATNGTCYNGANNYTLSVDTIFPSINTTFINNSVYYMNNLTSYVNFSDDLALFSWNISIDGVVVLSNISVGSKTQNIYFSRNVSNLSGGYHTYVERVADGHTAKALKNSADYNPDTCMTGNCLIFNFDGAYKKSTVTIQQKNKSWFDSWSYTKEKDRYKFALNPSEKKNKYVIEIESTEYIYLLDIPDSPYKKWLVTADEHWIDLYPYDISDIKKINNKKYEITIDSKDDKELTFSSIGDLNILTNSYVFSTINASLTYTTEVIESQTQTIALNISKTGVTGLNTTSNFSYNGVAYTPTKYSFTDYDYYFYTFVTPAVTNNSEVKPFYFNFSLITTTTTVDKISSTQNVFKINVDNCTNSSWKTALIIRSKNEETLEDLPNMTLNIDFNIWYETENTYKTTSYSLSGRQNYSFCIYPNTTTYRVNSIMEYQVISNTTSYENRKYYLSNYTLNNVTSYIDLYNIDASKASDVLLRTYDKATSRIIPDAYVKILRYYPQGNGSGTGGLYQTVEIEKTDRYGQTIGKLVLYDVFYKFIVEKNNQIILDSSVEKAVSTTKILPCTLNSDVLSSFRLIGTVAKSVTCTNITKTCRFTWSDVNNIVQTAIFKVYRTNAYGQIEIYSQETSAAAGTMSYTITESVEGNSYLATGVIHTNSAYSYYSVLSAILNFKVGITHWGGVSTLFPIMLVMITVPMALIGLGGIGVIIGSLIVLVIVSIIGFVPLTLVSIISFVILGVILIIKMRF